MISEFNGLKSSFVQENNFISKLFKGVDIFGLLYNYM